MIAERRRVLTMLHENKVTVDEAEGLLDALGQAPEPAPELKVEYVTANPKVEEVLDYARKIAATNAPVLIAGEMGTGKALVARMIHANSPRRDKVFLVVNCASLPVELLKSELFGHERGAFTGAIRTAMGHIGRADGGTLFLDEIYDLPRDLQAKLLRFMETGEFEHMGGTGTIRADVRIIAATNRDLRVEVKDGRFQRDLFYRLSVISLEIPPLRERVEDIPLLVDYFVKKYATQHGKHIPTIAPKAMDALMAHPWRGNVRELDNVIERAVILCSAHDLEAITVEHLLLSPDMEISQHIKPKPGSLPDQVDKLERQLVLEALEQEKWDRSKAAAALGIPGRSLAYKMAKHNIVEGQTSDALPEK